VLDAAFPLGVSNEFASDAVTVSVRAGYLTVVETLPDT
jgi:thiamine pyrophosphokinase